MQKKNPYEMCDFLSMCFLVDALLAATGSGGAFIPKGHVTSCQQRVFFFLFFFR